MSINLIDKEIAIQIGNGNDIDVFVDDEFSTAKLAGGCEISIHYKDCRGFYGAYEYQECLGSEGYVDERCFFAGKLNQAFTAFEKDANYYTSEIDLITDLARWLKCKCKICNEIFVFQHGDFYNSFYVESATDDYCCKKCENIK